MSFMWVFRTENPKKMSFIEAVGLMLRGDKCRLPDMEAGMYLAARKRVVLIYSPNGPPHQHMPKDWPERMDWEVISESK